MTSLEHLTVRLARRDDLDRLTEFSAAMAQETEGRVLDRTRLHRGTLAVFEQPDRGFFMVAEIPHGTSSLVVGQLLITYEWSDWRNAQFWWIQSVYVDPAWRRKGVYHRMHQAVVEQARQRNDVCGVRLYVETQNAVAQAVYQRVGLRLAGYQVFEEDFVLSKPGSGSSDSGQ